MDFRPQASASPRRPWRRRLAATVAASSVLVYALTWATLQPNDPSVTSRAEPLDFTDRVKDVFSGALLTELSTKAIPLYVNGRVERGDNLSTLLQRLGISDAPAMRALEQSDGVREALALGPKVGVKAVVSETSTLQRIEFIWGDRKVVGTAQRLSVSHNDSGEWQTTRDAVELERYVRLVTGTIESSLFASTDALGLDDRIAIEIAEVFSSEIDFRRDLRKGDRFTLAFEEWSHDGEVVQDGQVLAIEFVNKGKALQAIWFDEKNEYFDAQGNSAKREFLASPMKFSRISSGFKMRFHPIKKVWKRHLGVDYAAPTGTEVRSVGRGVVSYAGWKNGYGKVVIIRHNGGKETLYAHLSRIQVRKGQRIEREQNIGAVGSTGWATGPHLHFEFRVNGQHKNPALLAKQSKTIRLNASELATFERVSSEMQAALAAAGGSSLAKSEP